MLDGSLHGDAGTGRCEELVAIELQRQAGGGPAGPGRAGRERGGVEVDAERASREGRPAGPFDIGVCAEILYYWDRPTLEAGLPPVVAALRPGGTLVAAHCRGSSTRRSADRRCRPRDAPRSARAADVDADADGSASFDGFDA